MSVIALFTGLGLLLGGFLSLATSAIALECYNNKDNVAYKESRQQNYGFLIFNLVSAILTILLAVFAIFYIARNMNRTM